MARVLRFERAGEPEEQEKTFGEGMKQVGVSAAKELLAMGN